jgi:hypothetical protein
MSRKRTSGRYAFSDAKHCTLFEIGAAIRILQGIAESLCKVASDPPHILFKERDFAPRVALRATHEGVLAHCSLADLKRFAVDLS